MIAKTEYLFVYGTLRKNAQPNMHHLLAPLGEYLGLGTCNGELYDLGNYPGAVIPADTKTEIIGEVYKLADAEPSFAKLDQYEQCSDDFPEPREYYRKRINVSLSSGDKLQAWIYLYNWSLEDSDKIENGDFCA